MVPTFAGYDCILTVTDRGTKMVHLIAAHSTDTPQETARLFFHNVVRLHGLPRNIFSDRDARFLSVFWRSLCGALDLEWCSTSGFYPQVIGQAEGTNQMVKQILRTATPGFMDWSLVLDNAEMAINSPPCVIVTCPPFS